MSERSEAVKRWNDFVAAFENLGPETFGMTPAAASVLLAAAAEYDSDCSRGYRPLICGVPCFAFVVGNQTIHIPDDYPKCAGFWDVELNNLRAKVTDKGVEYVKNHIDIFDLLK